MLSDSLFPIPTWRPHCQRQGLEARSGDRAYPTPGVPLAARRSDAPQLALKENGEQSMSRGGIRGWCAPMAVQRAGAVHAALHALARGPVLVASPSWWHLCGRDRDPGCSQEQGCPQCPRHVCTRNVCMRAMCACVMGMYVWCAPCDVCEHVTCGCGDGRVCVVCARVIGVHV